MNKLHKQVFIQLIISIFVLILFSIISSLLGTIDIELKSIIFPITEKDFINRGIYFDLRIPRIILTIIAGACLSYVGLVFQAVLRNPLAEPYTLGIAGGASFGAVIGILLPIPSFLLSYGFLSEIIYSSWLSALAFLGAIASLFIVFFILGKLKGLSGTSIILAGITTNFMFSGLVMLIYFFSSPFDTGKMIRWVMGNIESVSYNKLLILILFTIPLVIYFIKSSRILNLLGIGSDFAKTRGIEVDRVYKNLIIFSSLNVSLIVSITGPIGFVGLIVPHITRRIIGYDHRILIVMSMIWGAIFLIICDLISRNILLLIDYTLGMPVGIFTSILGAVFFLWLLKKK